MAGVHPAQFSEPLQVVESGVYGVSGVSLSMEQHHQPQPECAYCFSRVDENNGISGPAVALPKPCAHQHQMHVDCAHKLVGYGDDVNEDHLRCLVCQLVVPAAQVKDMWGRRYPIEALARDRKNEALKRERENKPRYLLALLASLALVATQDWGRAEIYRALAFVAPGMTDEAILDYLRLLSQSIIHYKIL
jgi:hypothetical protein